MAPVSTLLGGRLHHTAVGWLQVQVSGAGLLGEPASPSTPAENRAMKAHLGGKCEYDASVDRV